MLTPEEAKLIKPFVTNVDQPVFGYRNVPAVIVGALFGRYSRSELSARELLVREFLANQEIEEIIGKLNEQANPIDPVKADAFFRRVLDQYGDDSVAELGGTALSIEGVSNVLTKLIEDRRIGLSPLEKSSRYVRFDKKDAKGRYPYYSDPDITKAGLDKVYEQLMNDLFDFYSAAIPKLMEELKNRFPQKKDQTEKSYTAALRAQACDVARYLLPMATKTNVGLSGNGRAFEYLIYQLRSSKLDEAHFFADQIQSNLEQLIPAFIRRSKNEIGLGHVEYLKTIKHIVQQLTYLHTDAPKSSDNQSSVKLIDYDKDGEERVAAGMLYENSGISFNDCLNLIKNNSQLKEKLLTEIMEPRRHRTHKPPRAFEHSYYQFEVLCDIGAYRDLHRHRILTQQRQPFTTKLGYIVPPDVVKAGLEVGYRDLMGRCAELFEKISKTLPDAAQYVVPFGYLVRFTMKMNAREAYHLCELRSTIQGHPSYRLVAHEMARAVQKVHPILGKGMMITWEGYDEMARAASEKKIEQLEQARLETKK